MDVLAFYVLMFVPIPVGILHVNKSMECVNTDVNIILMERSVRNVNQDILDITAIKLVKTLQVRQLYNGQW